MHSHYTFLKSEALEMSIASSVYTCIFLRCFNTLAVRHVHTDLSSFVYKSLSTYRLSRNVISHFNPQTSYHGYKTEIRIVYIVAERSYWEGRCYV
jgi:hypothetical protein